MATANEEVVNFVEQNEKIDADKGLNTLVYRIITLRLSKFIQTCGRWVTHFKHSHVRAD